jgi:hypothetical protein
MECGRHSVRSADPLVASAHFSTGAGGALIVREDIKARMTEDVAPALDDGLVSSLDHVARRELCCARVRQATATVV